MVRGIDRRDVGKERLWRDRLTRQASSGQSVRAFCQEEGVKESAFFYWRREIARRNGVNAAPNKKAKHSEALASVVVIDEPRGAMTAPIEVVLSGGVVVRVGSEATRQQLAMVLDALESGRC